MPSTKQSLKPISETPNTATAQDASRIDPASMPYVESEFTPRVWDAIIRLNPQLRVTFNKLLHQGQSFALDKTFDPKLFMDGLKRVLEALDKAGWETEHCNDSVESNSWGLDALFFLEQSIRVFLTP